MYDILRLMAVPNAFFEKWTTLFSDFVAIYFLDDFEINSFQKLLT